MTTVVTLTINGTPQAYAIGRHELLLEVLRDRAGCASVREGCGVGVCGACTAIVNGSPATTCLLLGATCDRADVLTAEGLEPDDPVLRAFADVGAMQCGYCTPGFVLMARDLLAEHDDPSPAQVDEHLAGNLCRCVAYREIREAVRRAAAGPEPVLR